MPPTVDRFRALARSSPWRWRTVQLTARWTDGEAARAWVRRPDGIRVEGLDGTLRLAHVQEVASGALLVAGRRPGRRASAQPEIGDVEVARDANGLIVERPWGAFADDPMYRDYRWVAMLDPAELADGESGSDNVPVTVEHLAAVDHHGRPAWEAVLRPTDTYVPRCSCCPLLHSAISDVRELGGRGAEALPHQPGFRHAETHRVRLDVATSICVLVEAIGGTEAGVQAEFAIEAVDAPLANEHFSPGNNRGRWRRR